MTLENEALLLVSPDQVTGEELADYYCRNREFLREYEPERDEPFYTAAFQQSLLAQEKSDWEQKQGFRFYIRLKAESDRLIGVIGLNQVVWGAFCSCFLGMKLDGAYGSRGYATMAVGMAVDFAFHRLGLHRIEANVMPRNQRSLRVLEKNGFEKEGLSRYYLKINGIWEDHIHMVKLNYAMHGADRKEG